MPTLEIETSTEGLVAGVDEVGRGPFAGPVVAAAVILDPDTLPKDIASRIDDSKKLSAARRMEIAALLKDYAAIGIGAASVREIEAVNILQATFIAMRRAVASLPELPALALVDGNRMPPLPCPARTIIKGDSVSLSIAAASIIAKVTRDSAMAKLDARYPGYGWARNAGYGTAEHRTALDHTGVTPHHRKNFSPIIKILSRT